MSHREKQNLPIRKVLIIDDDEIIRSLLQLYLTGLGSFEFWEASNGQAGLNLARQLKPDLVLVDLMMPLMDGIEFTRQMRENEEMKTTPIIVVTGANDTMKTAAYEVGANFVLEKPLNRKSMTVALERALP